MAKPTQKSAPVDTRSLSVEQRRELFLKARKSEKPDFQVLTNEYVDDLVPYGLITFDSVLGLNGIKRHGFVSQLHGDEGVGKCLGINNLAAVSEGLFYVDEIFQKNDLKTTCTSEITPKSFSFINRYGAAELTSHFTHNSKRPVKKIITRTGNQLINTENHPHQVMNKAGYWVWRQTSELKPGDVLVSMRKTKSPIGKTANISNEELYFLGTAIAESNDDETVLAAVASGGAEVLRTSPKAYLCSNGASIQNTFNSKEKVTKFYETYGFNPGVAKDKNLGLFVRGLSTDQIKHVIQGYVDCECSISSKGIEVSSASHKLLLEVKIALQLHFGIISVLKPKKVKDYPENEYWRLSITGAEADKYLELIGSKSEKRKEEFSTLFLPLKRNSNIDSIPNIGLLMESLYDTSETTTEHNFACRDYKGESPYANPSYDQLAHILSLPWQDSLILQRLREIYEADYFYDEIVEIKDAGEEPTFDFTLPETHSMIVNGIISHNSTLTYQIASNYQSYTGEPLGVFDFEGTGTPEYLEKIGCDLDLVKFMQPTSMEDSVIETLDLLQQGCRFFIYDSIPWINAEIDEKDIRSKKAFKASYGKHAQTMDKFFKALLPRVRRADGHMMMVNQTRSRIDDSVEAQWANDYSYTNKTYVLPGGRICRFTPATMIEMRMVKEVKPLEGGATGNTPDKDPFVVEPSTKETEGKPCVNRIRVRTLKNKVTGAGFREGFIWVRPATHITPGIDNLMSIRELARDYGFIANKGAKWYVGKSAEEAFITYPNKEAAIEDLVINRNPAIHQKLEALLKEAIAADTTGRFTSMVTKEEIEMIEGEEAVPVGAGRAFDTEEA